MLGVQTSTKPSSSIVRRIAGDRRVLERGSCAASGRGACRASGTGGAASRRRSPRRAGTAAASSARGCVSVSTWISTSPVGRFGLTASGARATTSPSAWSDELVAELVRDVRRLGGALRVDDELQLPGVVAQVDEDEAAVVAARVDPAGDGHAACRCARSGVRRSRGRASSRRERSDDVVERDHLLVARRRAGSPLPSPRTITTVRAPLRPACVIWPLNERPA